MSSGADRRRGGWAARTLAPLGAALALLGVTTGHAAAFALVAEPPASRMTMRLHLGDQRFASTGYGQQSWNSLAAQAMARWNLVGVGGGQDHEYFLVGDPAVSGNPCNRDDGVNEVRFAASICGLAWGDAIGIARRRVVDGRTVQVDILFNSQVPLNAYPGPLQPAAAGGMLYDFYRLALHEFGHAVGLAHPDEAGQVVDAVMNSSPIAEDLRGDDVAGARAVAWGRPRLEQFVQGFYANILGRAPGPGEVEAWVAYLRANPRGASALVRGFFSSPEFLTMRPGTLADFVGALYATVLLRPARPAEIQAWMPLVVGRLNRLVPGFVDSAEFQTVLRGTAPAAIVGRLYREVLGRRPSAAEITAWVDRVAQTGDWHGVALGFFNSPEYLGGARTFADHVAALYRTFLGRAPAPAEVGAWLAVLAGHLGEIEDGFTASAEFQRAF
jgi:hypothetical protein